MKEKIIVLFLIFSIIMVFVFMDTSNSVLGELFDTFTAPNWEEVKERNIVKNSIPITILENRGEKCLVKAEKFDYIINHNYFKRSQELANQLQYDESNETLIISCDDITAENSKLHVWYATEEAIKHSKKYEYFITPIKET